MPYAVSHIIVPILLLSLFRDYCVKNKQKFPLHYVLIGGIAGVIPDLDVGVFYVLSFFGYTLDSIHKVFTHNFTLVLIFIILGLIAYYSGVKGKGGIGKHHLQWYMIFYLIAFGIFTHVVLDGIVWGVIAPFYPFSSYQIGVDLVGSLPNDWQRTIVASVEAIMLVFWLVYMEVKHKISDFI